MLKYQLPHFSLDLSDDVRDQSIIALTLVPQGGMAFGVTLTHHILLDGTTLTDHVTTDIAERESRDGYAHAWRKPHRHEGMAGFIVAGMLDGAEERRLYLLAGKTVLLVSALTQGRFSAVQLDALNRLVQGLRATERAQPAGQDIGSL